MHGDAVYSIKHMSVLNVFRLIFLNIGDDIKVWIYKC